MIQRENARKGLLVRLLTDWLDVPKGTLATVETVGTLFDGTWWFTVRWHNYTPVPRQYRAKAEIPRKQYDSHSLNLWEKDLERFELATEEEGIAVPSPPRLQPKALRPVDPWKLAQLKLPFVDD